MCKEKEAARKAERAWSLHCRSDTRGMREGRKKAWVRRISGCGIVLRNVQPGWCGALESHVLLGWACLHFPPCSVIVWKLCGGTVVHPTRQ